MHAKTIVTTAVLLSSVLSGIGSAQIQTAYCVHLQWPVWYYGDGVVMYLAYRSDGLCGEGCESQIPVYYAASDIYLNELAHDCDESEGLQYLHYTPKGERLYVNTADINVNRSKRFVLDKPVLPDHDFFETWNSDKAPEIMRKGKLLQTKTTCESSNHQLVDPDTGKEIKVRIHKVSINADGCWPKTFYIAYERSGQPTGSVLKASTILRQEGTENGYRFELEAPEGGPFPEAGWFLLIRASEFDAL